MTHLTCNVRLSAQINSTSDLLEVAAHSVREVKFKKNAPSPRTPTPSIKVLSEGIHDLADDARDEVSDRLSMLFDDDETDEADPWEFDSEIDNLLDENDPTVWASRLVTLKREGEVVDYIEEWVSLHDIHERFVLMAAKWEKYGRPYNHPPPKHPLCALIVSIWMRPVKLETRRDKLILGVVVKEPGGEPSMARKPGMMFGGLIDPHSPAPELPLFHEAAHVAMLDMVDTNGRPVMANSRGVPLPLRIWIRLVSMIPPALRSAEYLIPVAMTVRELRDGAYANGWQRYRDWPKLRNALLEMRNYGLRISDRRTHFPWGVHVLPDEANVSLDDHIVGVVALPTGIMNSGPPIDLRALDALSLSNPSRYRAYIGILSLTWQLGITRIPIPKTRPKQWMWSRDEEKYPVLSKNDRRLIAFGPHNKKHLMDAEIDAPYKNLPGLIVINEQAVDPKSGKVGWRIVPVEAADAIVKRRSAKGYLTGEIHEQTKTGRPT